MVRVSNPYVPPCFDGLEIRTTMARTRIPPKTVDAARRQLRRDPVMRGAMRAVGPFTLRLETDRFFTLVRAIIAQQISTKAAKSILGKVEAAVGAGGITAEAIAGLADDDLRNAGVSPQKVGYLRSLAEHVADGELDLRNIGRRSDEAVIESLVRVKGIGVWTAQMFLIFTLGRPDVLPVDDLGIRANIQRLYGLDELPNRATCVQIAEPWRPYASIASWYLWRSGDQP